jgi:hypothetical protein
LNVLEPNGLPLQWREKGPAGRWSSIREIVAPDASCEGGEARQLVIQAPSNSTTTYTLLEMPGKGCATLGLVGLWGLLKDLDRRGWRFNGKRLDYKWDGVEFTPQVVDAANHAGQFVSRSLDTSDRKWVQDGNGKSTAYLGLRESGATKMLRVYDLHGFNRCEFELKDQEADDAIRALIEADSDEWSRVAVKRLLRVVDYRDRATDPNPTRCSRLDWWESFVGQAKKTAALVLTPAPKPSCITPLGRADLRVQKTWRSLWPMVEAFGGSGWLHDRVRYYGQRSGVTPAMRDEAEQLKVFKGSGMIGLAADDYGDVPF